MKQYIEALDKTGSCFVYLSGISRKFRVLCNVKQKAGIFDDPYEISKITHSN